MPDESSSTTVPEVTVSFADVRAARERIAGRVWRTPLVPGTRLGQATKTDLWFKAENLQHTGSFKVRGAINAVLQLSPEERARGVVTFSAGNHGQALAFAAQSAGVDCKVFMAENAVKVKVEAIRAFGAEIRFSSTIADGYAALERYSAETGARFVSPFADPEIIAGQGTVGLEILEDAPAVEQLVVAIGGGGLIAGIAVAVKALKPEVRIVGVEPAGAPTMYNSLQAGSPRRLEQISTIADGLAAPFTSPLPFALVQQFVDDVVLVSDDEISQAQRAILDTAKLLVEPAGAAATAALMTNKAAVPIGATTVAVLSGGNVDLARMAMTGNGG